MFEKKRPSGGWRILPWAGLGVRERSGVLAVVAAGRTRLWRAFRRNSCRTIAVAQSGEQAVTISVMSSAGWDAGLWPCIRRNGNNLENLVFFGTCSVTLHIANICKLELQL